MIPKRRKDRDAMLKRGSPYRGTLRAVALRLGCDPSLPKKVWNGKGKSARVRAAIEEEIALRCAQMHLQGPTFAARRGLCEGGDP